MASHEPFGHMQHELWSKEGPGVKLAVWFPTTKSRESTRSRCVQVECNTLLENSRGYYNFSLDLVPIRGQSEKLWTPKTRGVQTGIVLGPHFGNPGKKCHSDASAAVKCREYYMGGRWWLPPSPGRGESSESKVARGLSQHQECSEWILTNLLVGFGCRIE